MDIVSALIGVGIFAFGLLCGYEMRKDAEREIKNGQNKNEARRFFMSEM